MSQGERAGDREALATKDGRRRSGGCARKSIPLTWGDLASCLKGQRAEEARSEKSAEAEVVASRRRQGRQPAYWKPQAR